MIITEGKVRELAERHAVAVEAAAGILRDVGVTIVPDVAGRTRRPGDTVPTEHLHASDLVGEMQPDGQVWVEKSSAGSRRRFVSRDDWYRLAEMVAQAGGQVYLHDPESA